MSRLSTPKQIVSIGQVLRCSTLKGHNVAKVRIPKMSLDVKLLMYFPKKRDMWVADLQKKAAVGDIVIIRNLEKKFIPELNNKVDSILYKRGAVIDPVTGRPCRGTEFIDDKAREIEISRRDV